MKNYEPPQGLCKVCYKNKAEEWHHLLMNSKGRGGNRPIYGDLLDDKRNLLEVCKECHKWKPIPKFTELEFCEILGIEPRSKTAQLRKIREE